MFNHKKVYTEDSVNNGLQSLFSFLHLELDFRSISVDMSLFEACLVHAVIEKVLHETPIPEEYLDILHATSCMIKHQLSEQDGIPFSRDDLPCNCFYNLLWAANKLTLIESEENTKEFEDNDDESSEDDS